MRRGATVLEILVGLAVFALLTALITGVFILSQRYTRVSQQVSRGQREAAQCMQAFYTEVKRSNSQTYRPVAAVNQTWFLSNRPPDTDGQVAVFDSKGEILWQKWVAIWCESDGNVYRSERTLQGGAMVFGDIDLSTEPSSLSMFSSLPKRQRLSGAIRRFQVGLEEHVVSIDLDSETSNSGTPPTRYHMTSSFLVP
jgi:type II secretory pathway pseudopilin PulG